MRKLIVPAFITLDGVIQSPGGKEEDTQDGFAYGGWFWPYRDSSAKVMGGLFERPFELVLGRRTYDIFASFWPNVPEESRHQGIAGLFNATTKHVATHHPDTLHWHNSHALVADLVAALRELKRGEGPDLITQGSSVLVHQLLASDLVDELLLIVIPILLGRGKRLFGEGTRPAAFRLESTQALSTGAMISRYVREGEVRTEAPPA